MMDAAARQRQNDGFLKLVSGERFGKSPPGLRSISEWHHSLLCSLCEVGSWAWRRYRLSQFLAWSTNGFQGPAQRRGGWHGKRSPALWSSISTAWPSSGLKGPGGSTSRQSGLHTQLKHVESKASARRFGRHHVFA